MLWVAFLFSAVVVVLSVVMRIGETKEARKDLAIGTKRAADLSSNFEGLENDLRVERAALTGLREVLTRLKVKLKPSADAARSEDSSLVDKFAVDPRVVHFIDLVTAWKNETGQKLRGPAISDWSIIEGLTMPGARAQDAIEAEAVFIAAARRLVEYAVIASGTGAAAADERRVGKLLDEMAERVGLKLIDPQQGQRSDLKLHEPVNRVAAGGNRPGTIAQVEVRGLVRANGTVIRAKVCLYD